MPFLADKVEADVKDVKVEREEGTKAETKTKPQALKVLKAELDEQSNLNQWRRNFVYEKKTKECSPVIY